MAMNIFKHFTRGFTSTSASCMILLTAAGGTLAFTPASRDDQRLPMFYGTNPGSTHTKKDAAASATNQSVTSPAANSANVIIRDHRTPEGSQPANTPPAPSAKPTGTVVRDHRPGGNEDPCLKPKNTCNASDRNNSIVAYREKHPDLIGLDGDPCFQTKGKSCAHGQMIESMIARTEKNLNSGWCDPRITGQGCAQISVLPGGVQMVLHYQRNGGPLIEADRQRLLDALHAAYNKTFGGGTIQAPSANTAHRQN
jgi:hypothetical protein